MSNDTYDAQTIEVMKRSLTPQSNCVDVGCHEGAVLDKMVAIAPHGTHFAFEPIPDFHRKCVARFTPNRKVHIYELALSDCVGTFPFQHVVSNPAYSGLRRRRYDRSSETITEIMIRTNLLDNIIPTDVPIDFVKIDVEGAELQVLKGAIGVLRRSRPMIVFEHGLGAADYYGTSPEDMYELLAGKCELQISLMERWLNGEPPLSEADFCDQFYNGRNFYFLAHPSSASLGHPPG